MNPKAFEEKIKKELSSRFSIKPNTNREGLFNIFFDGTNYDLPVIGEDIREEIDPNYRYHFPNGHSARHWTVDEVMSRLTVFFNKFNDGEIQQYYKE